MTADGDDIVRQMMKAGAVLLGGLGLAAGLAATASAQAPTYGTAAFFHEHCKAMLDENNSNELYRQGECAGIVGALSYMSEEFSSRHRFCSPRDVTSRQLAQVLVAYIEKDKSRGRLDTPIIDLALAAFRQEWPCRK